MLAHMRLCHGTLVAALTLTPAVGRTAEPAVVATPQAPAPVVVAPTAAPATGVEGPAPAPEHPWVARNRELAVGSGLMLGFTGMAAIAVAATGGIYAVDRRLETYDDGAALRIDRRHLIISGAALGVAFTGLAIVGGLWLKHRRSRPAGLPPREKAYWRRVEPEAAAGRVDPRRDPVWARHDRNLTRGMLGTGITLGIALGSLGVTLGVLLGPCGSCEDNTGEVLGTISLGAIAGLVAIPFTGLAIARGVHRRPLRKWRATLAGGGLQIAF